MSAPEFSRLVDIREGDGANLVLTADEAERAALVRRFSIVAIDRLEARIAVLREGTVFAASGMLDAQIVQICAVSGENLPVMLHEPLALRFVPAGTAHRPDEEVELDADDLDEIEYAGTQFDLGEAVAQSLGLAIDPFATGPQAEEARRRAGLLDEASGGAFAALAGLKLADPDKN